jgi:hypothetical protein
VHGVDGGLDLVRAGLVAPQALPDDGLPFGDEPAIPPAAVLVGQQDQAAVRGGAGSRRASSSSISASSPMTSGSSGMSWASSRPSRIASAHRPARTSRSPELAV